MKADRDFSAMSEEQGMIKAFLGFVADSGVILRDNAYPTVGKQALEQYYRGKSDTSFTLTWEPLFEKISSSGDLGYTYGISEIRVNATGEVSKGTYTTIWQRQPDGEWKWILDTGNQGLSQN